MSPKILITGGTGYIGGSVLHTLATAHPEWSITALLRTEPSDFSSKYPGVRVVRGTYDDADVLAREAAGADVVVHNGNSDHLPSLQALLAGLLRQPREKPGVLIHLSGTGIVSDFLSATHLGISNPKIWSDISSLDEIRSLPDMALHRLTEKLLHETAKTEGEGEGKIRIAVMCPPDIYGRGLGPGKTKSAFVPMFLREVGKLGRVFYVGEGENRRSWVHVNDLMSVYLRLVEEGVKEGGGVAGWNEEGYYFAGSQEVSHMEVARTMGEILKRHGMIENEEPIPISLEQLDGMIERHPMLGRYLFASNSRTKAERAKILLDYNPQAASLLESIEDDILAEIKKD
ncbi:NAD(P)-binding protein [Aaosphaeria arxii CBS 175.79]|uniref:NAD(P)-binding protein n=1 Tax=Aaosphaeria arxii CBS 175.79 TaxID=1450172 RepID=A0A6A5Y3M5_9PLEO|nr:NAD(P)-binding protein [Aaosphaeria arxii CBS 175.79]KAF2020155.1 NAD(P)-binding protein [Aaosphaeria arxii CBS 175.79]